MILLLPIVIYHPHNVSSFQNCRRIIAVPLECHKKKKCASSFLFRVGLLSSPTHNFCVKISGAIMCGKVREKGGRLSVVDKRRRWVWHLQWAFFLLGLVDTCLAPLSQTRNTYTCAILSYTFQYLFNVDCSTIRRTIDCNKWLLTMLRNTNYIPSVTAI